MRAALTVSERRACRGLGLHRSGVRYEASADADEAALVKRMRELAVANPRYGYRRVAALLRAEGRRVNVKRVLRLWREAGLTHLNCPEKRLVFEGVSCFPVFSGAKP